MTDIVEMNFTLICECDEDCCDEVGEDICHDMVGMFHNGEDTYEWLFRDTKSSKRLKKNSNSSSNN